MEGPENLRSLPPMTALWLQSPAFSASGTWIPLLRWNPNSGTRPGSHVLGSGGSRGIVSGLPGAKPPGSEGAMEPGSQGDEEQGNE